MASGRTSSFESATQKLADNTIPFPLEDLPTDRKDVLWKEIKEDYQLNLPELSALKNYASKPQEVGQPAGESIVLDLVCLFIVEFVQLSRWKAYRMSSSLHWTCPTQFLDRLAQSFNSSGELRCCSRILVTKRWEGFGSCVYDYQWIYSNRPLLTIRVPPFAPRCCDWFFLLLNLFKSSLPNNKSATLLFWFYFLSIR